MCATWWATERTRSTDIGAPFKPSSSFCSVRSYGFMTMHALCVGSSTTPYVLQMPPAATWAASCSLLYSSFTMSVWRCCAWAPPANKFSGNTFTATGVFRAPSTVAMPAYTVALLFPSILSVSTRKSWTLAVSFEVAMLAMASVGNYY